MPGKPQDIVTGDYFPKKKDGEQIIDPKLGPKWRLVVYLPKREGSVKRPRKTRVSYGTERKIKRELQDNINEAQQELNSRTVSVANPIKSNVAEITFGEYMREWLEKNKHAIKRRTWESYKSYAENHVIPALGHIRLKDITPYSISAYKDLKLSGGRLDGKEGKLDAGTINKHLTLIRNALRDAAKPEKNIISYNPALLVERVKGSETAANRRSYKNCLRLEDLNELLDKLRQLYEFRHYTNKDKDEKTVNKLMSLGIAEEDIESRRFFSRFLVTTLYPVVYLTSRTGMRLSEVLALKWSNIDFKNQVIYVYESSHYGKKLEGEDTGHHINTTKEGQPKALITISAADIEFLKHHKKQQQEHQLKYPFKYHNNNLVFARNNGTYIANNLVTREFSYFAKNNGFNVTFHGLRHTHCTLLLAAGVNIAYVSMRVGHKTPNTTREIYWHAEKTDAGNLGEIFNNLLDKNEEFSQEEYTKAEHKTSMLLNKSH